jgi:hypothetical protein
MSTAGLVLYLNCVGRPRRSIPYAEFVDETISGLIAPARLRDAGWIVEWASLKAYPSEPSASNGKSSASIGTHAEQPSRQRKYMCFMFTSPDAVNAIRQSIPREGVAALPYTEVFINDDYG